MPNEIEQFIQEVWGDFNSKPRLALFRDGKFLVWFSPFRVINEVVDNYKLYVN
jgi:hypothetical protein